MKDYGLKTNFKNEETKTRLSHRLLKSYNYGKCPLESQFLCLLCHGISIIPVFCKFCGYSYCEKCFNSISDSKIWCPCKNSCKANFEMDFNHLVYNSYYFTQDKADLNSIKQIKYNDALYYENDGIFKFISSINDDKSLNLNGEYNIYSTKMEKLVNTRKDIFTHQILKKIAKAINFNLIKGYELSLNQNRICESHYNFLRMVHLNTISFEECVWDIEFPLRFNKVIDFNRKRLTTFNIYQNFLFENNLKPLFIILNALIVCLNLKEISIDIKFTEMTESLFPNSFYNYLLNSFLLKEINLNFLVFYDYMNFQPFQSLVYLEKLILNYCHFHINCFESLYVDNFPKLKILTLGYNEVRNCLNDQNHSKLNPKFKSISKFPPLLEILFHNTTNSLEEMIFQKLILFQQITMKSLNFFFGKNVNYEQITSFIKFLKSSKIQFLSLANLDFTEGFDSKEFLEYLRNSNSLQGLELRYLKNNHFKFNLLLQELSLNKSIQVLYLFDMNLSHFYSDLINFISINQSISTLILAGSELKIDTAFIDALLKNKTILYLIFFGFRMEDDLALKLSESNLKGINVDYLDIDQSTRDLIYTTINQIDYFPYLQDYENFLRLSN